MNTRHHHDTVKILYDESVLCLPCENGQEGAIINTEERCPECSGADIQDKITECDSCGEAIN